MIYTESAMSIQNKDDLIYISLDMQKPRNYILCDMKNELSELRKNCNKLEVDLKASKLVTETMKNHIVVLERKCWSNEQYWRRRCLEISGIPSDTEAGELKGKVLKVLEDLKERIILKNRTSLKLEIVLKKS